MIVNKAIFITKQILINSIYLNKVKINKKLMKEFIKKNDLKVK